MSRITWDALGERLYETGLDHGVLYLPYQGDYINGIPWNGLTSVSADQAGREASGLYSGNRKAGNVYGPDEYAGSIKAYTYPEEFEKFFGEEEIMPGVIATHQDREQFGFSYRTLKGNDTDGINFGYKIHLVYNAEIIEVSRTYSSVAESLDLEPMDWRYECFPIELDDGRVVAEFVFDSTRYDSQFMERLQEIIYGTEDTMPRLPTIDEIQSFFLQSLYPSNDVTYPVTLRYEHGSWLMGRTIVANGTYTAANEDVDGYSTVTVLVPGSEIVFYSSLPEIGTSGIRYIVPDETGFNSYVWDGSWIDAGRYVVMDPSGT